MDDEVTTKVAAEYLGVNVFRVLQLIKAGKLISDKKGTRDHWITAESLREYKKSRKTGRPRGVVSSEPAKSARYGTGEAAEREREYQREYKRRMREEQKAAKKGGGKKRKASK